MTPPRRTPHAVYVIQDTGYPRDRRIRRQAQVLVAAGWRVTVIAARLPGEPRREVVDGVHVRRYRVIEARHRTAAFLLEFAKLGIVGGQCYERHDGRLVLDPVPEEHVRGATKLWTRPCWEAIGGIVARLGWDTADEVRARRAGFTTRSIAGLGLVHLRPMGARGGMLRGMARVGVCAHATGCSPAFAVARSVKYGWIKRPRVLAGLAFAWGFGRALVTRRPRILNVDEVRWVQRRQRRRLARLGRALPER